MLCRFWCLHIVCSVHTQFPHDIQNRETSNTSDVAKLYTSLFLVQQISGKAVGKWQINEIYTNDTNSTLILYNFAYVLMFARRLSSAHTVSTRHTEKPQTHRMWQNCTRRFFWFIKFRKSSWKTTNHQNLHQWHQQHANTIQRCVGFDVCTSFVVCTHSFHTTFKREKPQTHRMRQTLHVAFFLVHQIQEKQLENNKSTKSTPMTPTVR